MKETNLILKQLNLKKFPDFITKIDNIDIKASEIKAENDYTIYKYIPIENIEILITNARRLDEPSKKIEEMHTLSYCFNEENEEEYNLLLSILEQTSDYEIKQVEASQEKFSLNLL